MINLKENCSQYIITPQMDEYQKLKQHNSMKQENLNELKKTFQMLNNEEDQLREKIEFTRDDLEKLDDEFNKIIESYSHIVKSFVRAPPATGHPPNDTFAKDNFM